MAVDKEKNTKSKPKKEPKYHMSMEEIEDFDNLYEYLRSDLLGYDSNQSLSSVTTLRLKGLAKNKFLETYKVEDTANYSYKVILATFKYSSPAIRRALDTVSFKDEKHKINYIFKIVEGNLNTVYMRMKNAEKNKKDINKVDMTIASNSTLNSNLSTKNNHIEKPKDKKETKNIYKDLW